MFFKRKKNEDIKNFTQNVFEVRWGGYYSNKLEDNKYGIFRLLDLNKDAYHIQLFKEKFNNRPTFEDVKELRPFILHVPIALGGLLNCKELTLIGHEVLDFEELEGYKEYFIQMGANEVSIKMELLNNLIKFSKQSSVKIALEKKGDQVVACVIG